MPRTVLITLQFDGGRFVGWQRQTRGRTVQAELERVLERLTGSAIRVHAAGRTDAGVHAAGLGVSAVVPERWIVGDLRRGLNALLPEDCWVASCHEMTPGFHARKAAASRRYRYVLGTDEASRSPFRRRFEWALGEPVNGAALTQAAAELPGEHDFTGFSVRSSPREHKRCRILSSRWEARPGGQGFEFDIKADRFLHHMVRMLVGTMVDIARDRRPADHLAALLRGAAEVRTSPPAPPQGLHFVAAEYPLECYA
jgi:tRNA pseudouridine38-40 synthase